MGPLEVGDLGQLVRQAGRPGCGSAAQEGSGDGTEGEEGDLGLGPGPEPRTGGRAGRP